MNACPKGIDLAGLRIGVPLDLIELEDPQWCKLEAFGRALFRLEAKGATVVNKVIIQGWYECESLSQEEKQIVLDRDMGIAINDYLAKWKTNRRNINNLQDLSNFTKTCPEEEYPTRNVAGLKRAQAADPNGELYTAKVEKYKFFAGCIESALDQYGCDTLLLPTLPTALQTFAAKAGSPVISVPMGIYSEGYPVQIDPKNGLIKAAPGIPFSAFVFGRSFGDLSVLTRGHAIEALVGVNGRLKPYMLPKTEVSDVDFGQHP